MVSAEEARARFARHVDLLAARRRERRARRCARPRARARRDRADRRAAVRSRQCRRLRAARRRHRGRERHRAAAAASQRRGDRVRASARARSRARLRHHDRDRRRGAARRRRGGDDRAHRSGRRERRAGDRRAPRGRRPGSSSPMRAPTSRAARWCSGAAPASARARSACWRPAASPRSRWCAGPGSRCSRPATSSSRRARALGPAKVYDSNGAIVAAAVAEAGGEPVPFGAFPDDEAALELAVRTALQSCDLVVLSGGTSKGAGDLSHRIVSKLGAPGILVHGVALKPGKPLCLAVVDGKPLAVLPGFPDLGDLHLPCLRRAGDPRPRRAAAARRRAAWRPRCRCASRPSSAARNSCWSRWSPGDAGPVAFPTAKGSGAVTSFSQADGFLEIDALASALDAGSRASVTLIGAERRAARSRRHGQPRHRARRGDRRARRAGVFGAHDRGRQPGRRGGGRARRMRPGAGASRRSGKRRLQRPSAAAGPRAGEGLAAHAGVRASASTTRALRAAAPPTRSRPRSPTKNA